MQEVIVFKIETEKRKKRKSRWFWSTFVLPPLTRCFSATSMSEEITKWLPASYLFVIKRVYTVHETEIAHTAEMDRGRYKLRSSGTRSSPR